MFLKNSKVRLEKRGHYVKVSISDREKEYSSNEFHNFCEDERVDR